MNGKERIKSLDLYKGLLIVLVVIRHVLQYSVADEGGVLTNIIWAVQMPGFMLVAGYFSARRIESKNALWKRLLRCLYGYALPFFSWYILVDILLLGKSNRNPIAGLIHLTTHVDGALWFLWVVFVLSIIFNASNHVLSVGNYRIVNAGITFIIGFGILCVIGYIFGIRFFGIKYILFYSVFYGFGWFCKWTQNWWIKWWPKASCIIVFLSLCIFSLIVFNYDLYHCGDDIISICLRCMAGFTGNLIILWICWKYHTMLDKIKLSWLGMYTLEIYVTHMNFVSLIRSDGSNGFYSVMGFSSFAISVLLTLCFTAIVIVVIKAVPVSDFLFYGKPRNINRHEKC